MNEEYIGLEAALEEAESRSAEELRRLVIRPTLEKSKETHAAKMGYKSLIHVIASFGWGGMHVAAWFFEILPVEMLFWSALWPCLAGVLTLARVTFKYNREKKQYIKRMEELIASNKLTTASAKDLRDRFDRGI